MRNTYKLCTQLQYMGQRQVANVGVLLTVNTKTLLYTALKVISAYSVKHQNCRELEPSFPSVGLKYDLLALYLSVDKHFWINQILGIRISMYVLEIPCIHIIARRFTQRKAYSRIPSNRHHSHPDSHPP